MTRRGRRHVAASDPSCSVTLGFRLGPSAWYSYRVPGVPVVVVRSFPSSRSKHSCRSTIRSICSYPGSCRSRPATATATTPVLQLHLQLVVDVRHTHHAFDEVFGHVAHAAFDDGAGERDVALVDVDHDVARIDVVAVGQAFVNVVADAFVRTLVALRTHAAEGTQPRARACSSRPCASLRARCHAGACRGPNRRGFRTACLRVGVPHRNAARIRPPVRSRRSHSHRPVRRIPTTCRSCFRSPRARNRQRPCPCPCRRGTAIAALAAAEVLVVPSAGLVPGAVIVLAARHAVFRWARSLRSSSLSRPDSRCAPCCENPR